MMPTHVYHLRRPHPRGGAHLGMAQPGLLLQTLTIFTGAGDMVQFTGVSVDRCTLNVQTKLNQGSSVGRLTDSSENHHSSTHIAVCLTGRQMVCFQHHARFRGYALHVVQKIKT